MYAWDFESGADGAGKWGSGKLLHKINSNIQLLGVDTVAMSRDGTAGMQAVSLLDVFCDTLFGWVASLLLLLVIFQVQFLKSPFRLCQPFSKLLSAIQ